MSLFDVSGIFVFPEKVEVHLGWPPLSSFTCNSAPLIEVSGTHCLQASDNAPVSIFFRIVHSVQPRVCSILFLGPCYVGRLFYASDFSLYFERFILFV